MELKFTKMNGLGNDYIFVNAIEDSSLVDKVESYIPQLSDRHFGVGGDGVIFVLASEKADCMMRMFNNDGREGPMCGNGIRELAKLVWDKNLIKKNPLLVETKSGILKIQMEIDANQKMISASVEMGTINLDPKDIPFISPDNKQEKNVYVFDYDFNGSTYHFYTGGIGSKHAVCYINEDVDTFDFKSLGKKIEQDKSLFPTGVNVEFVNIISSTEAVMRVWERGSGHTLACGTGATFVAGMGMYLGHFEKNNVNIRLERGTLVISQLENGEMIMEGEAQLVYDGIIDLSQLPNQ